MDRIHLAAGNTQTAAFALPGTDLRLYIHVHSKFSTFCCKPHRKLFDRTTETGKSMTLEVSKHQDLLQFRQSTGDRTGLKMFQTHRYIQCILPLLSISDHSRNSCKTMLFCQF